MNLARPIRRRRMSLTPMIDVVFLLLIFFMLAARFGLEGSIELAAGGSGAEYQGPPRLVEVYPATLTLNSVPVTEEQLLASLRNLTDNSEDAIILRMRDGADVQRMTDVMEQLNADGFGSLVLVE
jgi:biopolymer transport protein ExbD